MITAEHYAKLGWFVAPMDAYGRPLSEPTDDPVIAKTIPYGNVGVSLERSNLACARVIDEDRWLAAISQFGEPTTPQMLIGFTDNALLFSTSEAQPHEPLLRGAEIKTTGFVPLPPSVIKIDDFTVRPYVWLLEFTPRVPVKILPHWLVEHSDWQMRIERHGKRIRVNAKNLGLLFANLPEWKHSLGYDTFSNTYFWIRDAPQPPAPFMYQPPSVGQPLETDHIAYLAEWLCHYGSAKRSRYLPRTRALVSEAIQNASNVRFDQLQAYLNALPPWDGRARLHNWLVWSCGADDTEYTRTVGSLWLRSAVARAFNPGCKAKHVLAFVNPNETETDAILRTLGRTFYGIPPRTETHMVVKKAHGTKLRQVIHCQVVIMPEGKHVLGKWIIKIDRDIIFRSKYIDPWLEKQTDLTWSLNLLVREQERYKLRQFVCATHLPSIGLIPPARYSFGRMWPVMCHNVDIALLTQERDQLLAEAMASVRCENPAPWCPDTAQEKQLWESWTEPLLSVVGDRKAIQDEQLRYWFATLNGASFTVREAAPVLGEDPESKAARMRVLLQLRALGCTDDTTPQSDGVSKEQRFFAPRLRLPRVGRYPKPRS